MKKKVINAAAVAVIEIIVTLWVSRLINRKTIALKSLPVKII